VAHDLVRKPVPTFRDHALMSSDKPVSRLPRVPDPPPDPMLRELFEETRRKGGDVINLHLTIGHAPAIAKARRAMANALRFEAAMPRSLRELAIVRTGQIVGGDYELNQHLPMARASGLSPAQVDAIGAWRDSSLFDARQRALLGYVEQMAGRAGEVDDATFAELQRHFTPQEIVELTVVVANYYGTGLITKALRIAIEDDGRQTATGLPKSP
jgi:alkylhydroperoxidase family enzyme